MTSRRVDACLAGLLVVTAGLASAEEAADAADAAPDMEFLEYLGSWETSDEEWILFAGEDDPLAERSEPAPEDKASGETNDER